MKIASKDMKIPHILFPKMTAFVKFGGKSEINP